jgi:hypothetical protein
MLDVEVLPGLRAERTGGWSWSLSLEEEGGRRLASISFSPTSLILGLLSLASILLYGDVNASARALLLGQIFNG